MDKLSKCIINKDSSFIPAWYMRQAGRYLPEFRRIREKNPNFIKLCLNPELVTEITLQPTKRFNIDAAIIFSDILMIPYGLNQQVEFKKGHGPSLGDLDLNKILSVNPTQFTKKIEPVYEGISRVKKKIGDKSLIGFVGAPWTLLVYMINKQSPKKDFSFKNTISDKSLVETLLKKIEQITCLHADKQIEAGANIIQIFDSWANLLPKNELDKYCYQPNRRLVEHIKSSSVPAICFPRGIGENYIDFCSEVKPDCINIDYEVDPVSIRKKLKEMPIQGGLDPKILLKDHGVVRKEVENYLNIFSNYPYIFNLGHGVLPETNPETIEFITNLVRSKNAK